MNKALRRPMTQREFLSWVEAQEGRFEFDGLQPVAMTGGTNNHGIISGNLYFALRRQLGSGPCRPLTAEAGAVATIGNKVRYPDVTVTCSPIVGTDRLIPEPVVVFEVTSAASAQHDHGDRRIEYQALPSVTCYVVAEQSHQEVTVYRRDGTGALSGATLRAGGLDLSEIGAVLTMDGIYAGVALG